MKKESKFWQGVRKSAQNVLNGPDWMRAGITLNPEHFITYPSVKKDKMKNINDTILQSFDFDNAETNLNVAIKTNDFTNKQVEYKEQITNLIKAFVAACKTDEEIQTVIKQLENIKISLNK